MSSSPCAAAVLPPRALYTVIESSGPPASLLFGLAACAVLAGVGLPGFLGKDRICAVRGLGLIAAGLLLGFLQLNWQPNERTPELGWEFFVGLLNLAIAARFLTPTHHTRPAEPARAAGWVRRAGRVRRTDADVLTGLIRRPGYTGGACLLVVGTFLTVAGLLGAEGWLPLWD